MTHGLHLHNTLTRQLEKFVPLHPPLVTLYTCGPTVWNYAHIGNFRTFLFEDLLRRWLEFSGYQVYHIMNLTDVDDRIIKEAGARKIRVREFVDPFIEAFYQDRDYLRIQPAHDYPRAILFIPAMIRLVQGLLDRGVAYLADDGSVYFSIEKFPAYGRLSQLDRRELRAGASERVATDEYAKEDARDFALWKAARPEDEAVGAAWDAPFGRGRPGWHLECSAMALELLDKRHDLTMLDIHAGGVDLIFPHHEDEIAQSCAFTGEAHFARYWLHGEFLKIRGTKMSKRFGNITTARDLREDGVDAGAIRLLLFGSHYRQALDMTDDGLAAAQEAARRLGEFSRRLRESLAEVDSRGFVLAGSKLRHEFRTAMDDDLNAPRGIASMFEFMVEANRLLDAGERPGPSAVAEWQNADAVLDVCTVPKVTRLVPLIIHLGPGEEPVLPPEPFPDTLKERETWALAWANARGSAKANRDFVLADRIRQLLLDHGYDLRDSRDGTVEVIRL